MHWCAPVWEPMGCAVAYVPQPYAPMLYAASDSTIGRGTAARSVVMTDWNSASVLQVGMLPGLEHDTLHARSRLPVCMPDPVRGSMPLQLLEQRRAQDHPRLAGTPVKQVS